MRKIYSLILLMLLPVLAVAQDNQAISSTYGSNFSTNNTGSNIEKRINVPFAAAGVQQEAMTSSDAGANFSVGMWINTTGVANYNPKSAILFRMGTLSHANNNGALQLMQSSTGAITLLSGGDNIGATGVSASMGTASLNEWHHILLTLDSQNNLAAVYVDGEQTGTSSDFTKFGYKWGDGVFQFACMCWSGSFDELQLYNSALTADEAKAAYYNARAVGSLTTLYTFDAVKSGSTGAFENVAGSVSGSDAKWETVTYENHWESGLCNSTTTTETAPTLVEGRTIAATEAAVTLKGTEGGVLSATDGTTTYATAADPYTISTGTSLTVTATPNNGYNLIGIYAVDANNNRTEIANGGTYVVVGDITIEASFTSEAHALTVNNALNVPYTLTYNGQAVTDLTQLMGGGAEYKLTLNVPDNLVLESVQLGDQTLTAVDGVYTITLDADATLTINARNKAEYTVTINQPAGGTVSVSKGATAINSGDKVLEGDVLTLSYTKDTGYAFVNYIVNGANTTSTTLTVTGDVTISALFEIQQEAEYTEPSGSAVAANGYLERVTTSGATKDVTITRTQKNGTVYELCDSDDEIIEVIPGQTFTMNLYAKHTNTSTASAPNPQDLRYCIAFIFTDWDGDGTFEYQQRYGLGAGESGFAGNVPGNYASVMDITPSFTVPDDAFVGRSRIRVIYTEAWDTSVFDGTAVKNGGIITDGNYQNINKGYSYDFCVKVLKQNLENPRTVTVVSADENLGTVAITSPATEGSSVTTDEKTVTVKATPAADYAFLNWTNGEGAVVSTDATYKYTGETDVTLTANFGGQVTYTVGTEGSATFEANGAGITSGDVLALGTEVTVTVTPDSGKQCIVTINGSAVTLTDNAYTFTVEANAAIDVQFVDQICYLHLLLSGNGTIQVWTGSADRGTPSGTQLYDGDMIPSGTSELFVWFIPAKGKDAQGNDAVETVASVSVTNGGTATNLEADNEYWMLDAELDECPADAPMIKEGAWYTKISSIDGDITIDATFSKETQGIEEIGIDPANGPVEYYNLQGVRVAADNLVPGFYIVRQGSKAAKVLIQK